MLLCLVGLKLAIPHHWVEPPPQPPFFPFFPFFPFSFFYPSIYHYEVSVPCYNAVQLTESPRLEDLKHDGFKIRPCSSGWRLWLSGSSHRCSASRFPSSGLYPGRWYDAKPPAKPFSILLWWRHIFLRRHPSHPAKNQTSHHYSHCGCNWRRTKPCSRSQSQCGRHAESSRVCTHNRRCQGIYLHLQRLCGSRFCQRSL